MNYIVMTGDGTALCDGVSEYEIERVAQGWADRLGQTVYYTESGADLDDEDAVTVVEPRTLLLGYDAIAYAEKHGVRLCKYADPTEGARDDLTPDEARAIAAEDPSLIYLDVTPSVREHAVIDAAIQWWRARRPVGWSEAQHLERPAINTTTPREAQLANAVAEFVRHNGHASFADDVV